MRWLCVVAVLACGGAVDESATKTVLTTGVNVISNIVVDEANVYWGSSDSGGTIYECAIGGCAAPTVLASMQGNPVAVAVDSANVYWTNQTTSGTVMRCAIAGCVGSLTALASGQDNPSSIAVGASNVYWTNLGTDAPGSNDGAVMTCSTAGCGGSPTTLVSMQSSPSFVVVDAANVYWLDGNQLQACPIAGCSNGPTHFVSYDYIAGFVIEGTTIYWAADGADQAIMTCALSGCGGGTGSSFVPVTVGAAVTGIAIDENAVYWASSVRPEGSLVYTSTVNKCALTGCGGKPVTLWSENTTNIKDPIVRLAVGANSLYTVIDGDLVKIAPK